MKFLKFMEAKFTEHSLAQQMESFSIMRDGEQKASQTFIWAARKISKWYATIKLPVHWALCKVHILAWPKDAESLVTEFTEKKQEQAKAQKAAQIEAAAKDAGPGKVVEMKNQPAVMADPKK